MRRSVHTGLRVASAILVASGYMALATTPAYPLAIVIVPFTLFLLAPLGERLDKHFPMYRRITYWLSIVTLVAAIGSIFFIQLLGSVTVLVMYIQAYTILHQKRVKSYYHLYLMSFFLLLAASVMSPEPEIGVAMALFLASAVVALTLLHLHREMEANPEHCPPAVLHLNVHDLPLAPSETRRGALGLAVALTVVVLISAVITAGLFYVTPRMQAGILGRTDPMLFRPAFTQLVELAGGGRIVPDQTPVMHVEFPDEPDHRFESGLFWRISSLNDYRLSHWTRVPLSAGGGEPYLALERRNPYFLPQTRSTQVRRRAFTGNRMIHQSIYMDSVPQEGVPALTLVERLECPPGTRNAQLTWDEQGDFSVVLTRTGQRWLKYDAWSEVPSFTPEQLRGAPDDYEAVLPPRSYEMLTHQDLEPRTLELVRQIVAGKTTVYDKVLAVGAYFNSGGYLYTLDLPILPQDHPVDVFIHDTKVGHCELFSSAMALMLRSLGIPTRVVAGYRGGDWSESDRSYIVRADMAHLWVEVYFIGLGWVTFDPSPSGDALSGFSRTWIARTIMRYSLRAKMAWYTNVIAYDHGLQVDSLKNVALGLVGFSGEFFDRLSEVRQVSGTAGIMLSAVLAAVLVVGGTFMLLLNRRPRRPDGAPLTADQARAVRLYGTLQRKVRVLGTNPRGKTAEELCQELRRVAETNATPAINVINAYNETRFGGRPLPWERYARLKRAVKKLHFSG